MKFLDRWSESTYFLSHELSRETDCGGRTHVVKFSDYILNTYVPERDDASEELYTVGWNNRRGGGARFDSLQVPGCLASGPILIQRYI
jgi:hypothetical protein